MNLLIKERASGKTTGLIYTSEMTRYPIVVNTNMQKMYIKNLAQHMGCDIPEPLTVIEIRHHGIKVDKVLVDELQTFLPDAVNEYLGCEVVCSTMTDVKRESRRYEELIKQLSEDEKFSEMIQTMTINRLRGKI